MVWCCPHLSTLEGTPQAAGPWRDCIPCAGGCKLFARGWLGAFGVIASASPPDTGLNPAGILDAADLPGPLYPLREYRTDGHRRRRHMGCRTYAATFCRQVRQIGAILGRPPGHSGVEGDAGPSQHPDVRKSAARPLPPAKKLAVPCAREPRLIKWRCAWSQGFSHHQTALG